jgi:hypothetical protein
MPKTAKVYITCVAFFGLALLAGCLMALWQPTDPARLAGYLAVAILASTFKIRLPGIEGTISINFLLILMSIAALSLDEALIVGCAATAVQCYWGASKQPKKIQVAFNLGSVSISIGGAWAVRALLGQHNPAALVLEATVFFMLNTGMVSMVLSLIGGKPLLTVWRQCHLYAFPYYLVGAVIAGCASAVSRTAGWESSLLILPMMYLVYAHYELWVAQRLTIESAARR